MSAVQIGVRLGTLFAALVISRWPLTAQGTLDRARLVWMADFGDGQEI